MNYSIDPCCTVWLALSPRNVQVEHDNLKKLALVDENFQIWNILNCHSAWIIVLVAYNNVCLDNELNIYTLTYEKTVTIIHKEIEVLKALVEFVASCSKVGHAIYKVTATLSPNTAKMGFSLTQGLDYKIQRRCFEHIA